MYNLQIKIYHTYRKKKYYIHPLGSAGEIRDAGSIPGLGRCPGGGNGNPLQYSCLENPVDRGALQATRMWGHKESDTTEPAHTHYPQFQTSAGGIRMYPV